MISNRKGSIIDPPAMIFPELRNFEGFSRENLDDWNQVATVWLLSNKTCWLIKGGGSGGGRESEYTNRRN
jgi:hypothetical protein